MQSVCAWCRAPLHGDVGDPGPVSHGICTSCLVRFQYRPQPFEAFLETLGGPVMAVDAEGRVLASNHSLRGMVGKQQSDVLGRLGGEVISCIYSELPGGCGRTAHCLGCSIRNAVNETRESGQPKVRIPAFAYVRTPDGGMAKLLLHISTECAGALVMLRVDDAEAAPSDRPDVR
jgi:hypothetical protein